MKTKSTKPKFKISDYKSMQYDASFWGGIEFTIKQIKDILKKTPEQSKEIWDDFESVGHPDEDGMDTAVRDIWFSAIGEAFTGRDWPIGAESKKTSDKFFVDLSNGLKKAGIKFNYENSK